MNGTVVITCICIAYLIGPSTEYAHYSRNQLWKVTNDNKTALNLLQTLEKEKCLIIWGYKSIEFDAMIDSKCLFKVKEKLLENKLKYEIIYEDLQRALDDAKPKPQKDNNGSKGYRLTWNYYHNLDDIYEYLHYLEVTFPKLCTVSTIGHSIEGRPIKLLRISGRNLNPDNKAIFIEGGIHSNEWISPASVTYIINQFVTNYDEEASYVKNLDWYLVPVLNPDGYTYSYDVDRMWRKNRARSNISDCVGVDLNRNWDYDWDKNGSSSDPCSKWYKGKKPFSEPETAAVANFFTNNSNIHWVGYLAMHSYGQFIIYPWGSLDKYVEDHDELQKVGMQAAKNIMSAGGERYIVGPAGHVVYPATGTSIDWARGVQAIKYSYTLELRDKRYNGYILPTKYINATCEDALITTRTIAQIINN